MIPPGGGSAGARQHRGTGAAGPARAYPEVYDYYAGGSGSERTLQTSGARDLLTGMTDDLAHEMALAGARTLAGSAGGDGTHDSA